MRNHKRTHGSHAVAPRVKLKKSKKKLSNVLTLMETENVALKGQEFKCSICKEVFPSRGAISKHSKMFHENSKPFQCDDCGQGFTRRGTLRIHQEKNHQQLSATLP